MEGGDDEIDFEREEDEDVSEETELLKDRFRLSVITIAESEGKKNNMEISQPVMSCIADLAFQFSALSFFFVCVISMEAEVSNSRDTRKNPR
ncbi:Centromere protein s-like [Thalictrum thalictroides]|uniref:Centromere protein s-like n=2 Tax=Thalictrum thalictroides TaxID=46969 RepID=A0A7J6WZ87_THATH|nr:Centromere protein s-like [Thalictrum thalictroides]